MARFGDLLRGFASVLSPQVAQEVAAEDQQNKASERQMGMFALQNLVQDKRFQQEMANKEKESEANRAFQKAKADEDRAARLLQFEQTLDARKDQLAFQRDQSLRSARNAEERLAMDKDFRTRSLQLQEDSIRLREQLAKGTNQQIVGNEGKLRDDYNQLSKTFIGVRDAHQRVMASANDPSAAGDLALIFNYMKVLDPTSVVRESEFAQAARTGAFGERIKAAVESVVSGKRLSDNIRADFLDRSERLYKDAETNQVDLETRFTDISKRSGVNHENVVIPYRTTKTKGKDKAPKAAPKEVNFGDLK
jgi:hypothetical protein